MKLEPEVYVFWKKKKSLFLLWPQNVFPGHEVLMLNCTCERLRKPAGEEVVLACFLPDNKEEHHRDSAGQMRYFPSVIRVSHESNYVS